MRQRHLTHNTLGRTYAQRGLLYLVRRGGAEYRDVVSALASRVCDLSRLPPLREAAQLSVPPELADPLELTRRSHAQVPAAHLTKPNGPKHVEFMVVAAHQAELRSERSGLTAYGSDFDEWCPFLPAVDTRVGLLVQRIAIEQNLTANVLPVAQNIIGHLQHARAKNTLVVLVVDVWSLRLPAYRSYMNLFDGAERFRNAGALVVWNLADGETLARKQELVDTLRVAFPNLTIMPDPPAFHHQLGTPDELAEKLRATLLELRRRISNFGEVMRKAEGFGTRTKPLLLGPEGL